MKWWVGLMLWAAGCDVPTELPKWNPEFAVPVQGTSITIAQLLPSSVTVADGAFALSVAPVTFGTSLGQLCAPCAALHGQTVPKPAFNGTLASAIALPPDVVSGTVSSGWLHFSATNGFSFDPIRPGAGATGSVIVRVVSDGVVLGTQTITGAVRAWPPGGVLTDSVALMGTGTAWIVELMIDSPSGNPARIDANAGITVIATPAQLRLTAAQLRVQNRQVTGQPLQLNLTGIDDFITGRVQGGKLVLTFANGFGVGGTMTVNVSGVLAPISKQVVIPAADATVDMPFTEAELESMLGRVVTFSFAGVVSSPNPISVTPASSFVVTALLVLELGSSG